MISLENLNKSFGNKLVLNNISIGFNAGTVYGIVGENGAGKTTLFKCIAGLENYQGNVDCVYGRVKDKLGFLQTNPYFFSKITGREYLQLLCNGRGMEQQNFEAKNIFDLPLNQYAETYSTGMKKKLAITALLIQKNELFILDEPFNGVDIQSNLIIIEIIRKLKMLNKCILVSSHVFSTLNEICDEIHLLKDGRFVKAVLKDDFELLNQEMKSQIVSNRLDELDLS